MNNFISLLDEELKTKAAENAAAKQALQQVKKKEGGNLISKSLDGVIDPRQVVDTENLTTVFVAFASLNKQVWDAKYETLCQFIVPRSSKVVAEDTDSTLVSVILFKRVLDNFKTACREFRFTVRDTTARSSGDVAESKRDREVLETRATGRANDVQLWCEVNFGEALAVWLHIKAVRVFVESVLRFGPTAKFQAILLLPLKKQDKNLRKALQELYGGSGGDEPGASKGEINTDGLNLGTLTQAANARFYPYVYIPVTFQAAEE
jgi:V-type H+-transporting ATPase subunit C